MPKTDKRIDDFIVKSADFAQPVLIHLRKLVHEACPDVEETMKWSFPFFDYKGPLCNMGAFKAHCSFGFWKATLLPDPKGVLTKEGGSAGSFGKITSLKDLPADKVLTAFIKAAKKLNDDNVKVTKETKPPSKELPVPDYMMKALKKNKKAFFTFEEFSPSHRKEYIQWITEAKTEETRLKRMDTMMEWLVEGKSRHWKYK
jgi:uncharacterized protein YdeI (YjbR/CyaY-like superfamily)